MKNDSAIYLDYNATTPCDPRVLEKMLPFFNQVYGNPANGLHRQGRSAARAVDEAREQVADLVGAKPREIVFTSGATESNNLFILGFGLLAQNSDRKRIGTSAVEHKSVLLPCKQLEKSGFELVILPVDAQGIISADAAKNVLNNRTLLVSIQAANNEIGSLQPIAEIAEIAHCYGAVVHCDAAQAVGKISVDVNAWGIDILSMSAHKMYGPKGVGALYIKGGSRSFPIKPQSYGGGQEYDLRPGTLNVPAIVGFGEACRIANETIPVEAPRIASLRDTLEQSLLTEMPDLRINGARHNRLPNTSSITFPGIDADALMLNLSDVMIGAGSACSSGAMEPSHVLQAIGLSRDEAYSTVRISLGRFTTERDAALAVEDIRNARMRASKENARG